MRDDGRLVICGVDGSRGARVAAEQAAALARGGMLTLVAVAYVRGSGPNEMADLDPPHGRRALDSAREIALAGGVDALPELVRGRDAAAVLTRRAADADLLVIGAPVSGRAQGIVLGATATRLLHTAPRPVLVARTPPRGHSFPDHVLVATDGSRASRYAITLAGAIAAEHRAAVTLLHAGGPAGASERRRIAEQEVELLEATGTEPLRLDPSGDAADAIVDAARSLSASLVVTGARGVSGLRALGSVSERVAHRAPCSVLVARG